jgi:hypothetical protein
MKKLIALTLTLLLVAAMLFGCGAKSHDAAEGGSANRYEPGEIYDKEISGSTTDSSTTTQQTNQKLVRKVWLNAETEDLDALLATVDSRITELSGYVENREVYNGSNYSSHRYRTASLTIRIPADKLDEFVNQVTENSNIVSQNETTENITLSYADTESRQKALEVEQTRLLELLARAESMEDILKIEERLTQVRTELEEVTSRLRVYDNMVDYGTIYLEIYEVREYTVVEEPETVWERIGTGFMESLEILGNFFVELFVFIIVALPFLIPIGLVITALILLRKRAKRKKAAQTKEEE